MNKCPNCNQDASEQSVFCPNCGTRLNAAEPVQEPMQEPMQEPVQETCEPVQEVQQAQETVMPVVPETPAEPESKADWAAKLAPVLSAAKSFLEKAKDAANMILDKIPLPRKIVGIIGAGVAAVLVLIIILAITLSGGKDPEFALYAKDGDLFFSNLKKDKEVEIISFSSELSDYADDAGDASALNESGNRLFYPVYKKDGSSTEVALYYRDLNKKEGVKVDSDVSCYAINAKGTSVIYLKDGSLYKSNLKDKEKLASDVDRFYISKDFKNLLYINEDSDIYFKSGNKDANKLASEAKILGYDTEKLGWFFYTKEDALYFQKTNGDEKVKVDSEYNYFEGALEGGKAYYIKKTTTSYVLWDYVEDDLADADAAMVEPVAPEWPTKEEYPKSPEYPWSFEYETTEEYNAALEQYNKDYEKYLDEIKRIDDEYQAATDKYYEDRDAYYDARDLWDDKEDRDSLRENLKESTYDSAIYSLYYFNGKESVLVVENMRNSYCFSGVADAAAGYVEVSTRGSVDKVKMSEIKYTSDVYNKLEDAEDGDITLKAVWAEKSFDFAEEEIDSVRFSYDAKTVYILINVDDEKGVGELHKASFSAKGLGEFKKLDTDVSTSGFGYVEDAGIIYLKDYKNGKGDLYVEGKEIDYDVTSGGIIVFRGGYLYASGDELKYFKNGKKISVAEDIAGAVIHEDTLVLLYDYNSEKQEGILGVFNGSKMTQLDDEVSNLANPSAGMIHYIQG